MAGHGPDNSQLDRVLDKTLEYIQKGKEEVFAITEEARGELERVKSQLKAVKQEALNVIDEVDELEREEIRARRKLMEVSRDFTCYNEEDIHEAYQRAQEIKVKLSLKREKEYELKRRRDEFEKSLINIRKTVERAENLTSHMSMALDLLKGGFLDFSDKFKNLRKRHSAGIGIIQAQEEERRRIAREIHDGPAQSLANIVFRIGYIQKMIEHDLDQAIEEIRAIRGVVKDSLSELRRVIFNLRPATLDDLGLVPTIRNFIDGFQQHTGLYTELSVLGDIARLAPDKEIALFRMIQEAMNNAFQHAEAHNLTLKIEFTEEHVRAEVLDDGCGFDPQEVLKTNNRDQYGINGLHERAELLEGKVAIESEPGSGTRVKIIIPRKGEHHGSPYR